MKRILVIGSNSFSGSDFIDLLLEKGSYEVWGVSRSPQKGAVFLPYIARNRDLSRYRFSQIDLNHDVAALLEIVHEFRPQYVVNFAAQSEVAPSWDHPEHWFQTNVVALAEFINRLRLYSGLERYLHVSSPEVYGTCQGTVTEASPMNPSTPYAASKASADFFLQTVQRHFNFPLVTVRATNVYGAHQQLFKIIPKTVINLKLDRPIELHGGGVAVKSYIHIRDVSCGELAILEHGQVGRLYHLSPPQGIAVRKVVQTVCDLMGRDFDRAVRVVAERLGQDAAYIIDSTAARTELGWSPKVSLEQGLQEVISWVDRYWAEIATLPHTYVHKA